MHSARKLRSVAFADEPRLVQGRSVEGVVIGLGADGKATFRDEVAPIFARLHEASAEGQACCRLPQARWHQNGG